MSGLPNRETLAEIIEWDIREDGDQSFVSEQARRIADKILAALSAAGKGEKVMSDEGVTDECRIEVIDGEAIRVHGAEAMDDEGREAFAQIVRAAKARLAADPPPTLTHDPCCSSHGVAMTCARYRRTHFVEVRPCCEADAIALGLRLPA